MATRWLSDDESSSWRNFISAIGPLMDALERDLLVHHLTFGEYEVLVFLSEAPQRRMRMGDLAEALRLSPSGLTRRLDNLVLQGFVVRVACPEDRRVMYAHLPAAGMDKLRSAAPGHLASVRRHLFDALTDRQVLQLGQIFTAVRERLGEPAGD